MGSAEHWVDFYHRWQEIQKQQTDSAESLLHNLFIYYDKVQRALQVRNQEIHDELKRCRLDKEILQARAECYANENEQLKDHNKYILVIIDGNVLLFRDLYARHGVEGGRRAAQLLGVAVTAQCGEYADDVEVIVKVIANFDGLAKSLGQDLSRVKDFALGFTNAKAAFDFIDVGSVKHGVSSKIKDTVKWHFRNCTCRHVFMGISRDASYEPFLDDLSQYPVHRRRLTIIEGASARPEVAATNIATVDFGEIFRAKTLDNANNAAPRTASPAVSVASSDYPRRLSMTYAHAASSAHGSPRPTPQLTLPFPPKPNNANNAAPRTASPAVSVASSDYPRRLSMTYAHAASSAHGSPRPTPQLTLPFPSKPIARPVKVQYQQIPPQQPDWDPGHRGLDAPITVSVTAMESIKKRKEAEKLCNNHFLRGPCAKGDSCFFVHNYKPNSEELHAIAVLARQNPCVSGQSCALDDCIYGHHCPNIRDGICTHPYCKFPEDAHPPGTKFKNPNAKAN